MLRRTTRASTAGSIGSVSPSHSAPPDTPCPHLAPLVGRRAEPRLHVRDRGSLLHAVQHARVDHAVARELLDPPPRLDAVAEEGERGKERERVDPQPTPGEEGAPQLDPGNRPRLPRPPLE